MAIEVFNRYEKKYLLNENDYLKIKDRISDYMVADRHNHNDEAYKICNIYYDSPDDRLIRASIERPIYKEKLRLRSYGIPKHDDKVYLEIKKKYNGIVNKRRIGMMLDGAYEYLCEGIVPNFEENKINYQIFKEIDYLKNYYGVVPKLYLSYDRYAFFERDDGDFRITFDSGIITRRYDLQLEKGSYGEILLGDDNYVMEIKTNGGVPRWFLEIISEFNIYPISFSKYGTEYKRHILQGRED